MEVGSPKVDWGGKRGKRKGLHYLWGFHVLCNEMLMKFPFIIGVF